MYNQSKYKHLCFRLSHSRLEVMPQGGEPGTYVSNGYLFDVTGYKDLCGTVEYTDGRIERIVHETGWIDAQGRHVAAIRDSRGSLRATLTHGSVRPAQSGSSSGGGLQFGGGLGGGSGVSAATGYENLTAYYPFGLPFSDWQGGGRDLFSGKELERTSGLFTYDFHARRYDPQLGLFLAPDPLAGSYPNLNPYLYCAANPVSLTDPTDCIIELSISEELEILHYSLPPENRQALTMSDKNMLEINAKDINNWQSQNTQDLIYMNTHPNFIQFRCDTSYDSFIDGSDVMVHNEMKYIPKGPIVLDDGSYILKMVK